MKTLIKSFILLFIYSGVTLASNSSPIAPWMKLCRTNDNVNRSDTNFSLDTITPDQRKRTCLNECTNFSNSYLGMNTEEEVRVIHKKCSVNCIMYCLDSKANEENKRLDKRKTTKPINDPSNKDNSKKKSHNSNEADAGKETQDTSGSDSRNTAGAGSEKLDDSDKGKAENADNPDNAKKSNENMDPDKTANADGETDKGKTDSDSASANANANGSASDSDGATGSDSEKDREQGNNNTNPDLVGDVDEYINYDELDGQFDGLGGLNNIDYSSADSAIRGTSPLPESSKYTRDYITAKTKECTASFKRARDCCEGRNSLACLPGESIGGDGVSGASLAMGTAMGSMVLQAFGGQSGITQNCDLMKTAGISLAGVNTATAAGCYMQKKKCDISCDQFSDEISQYKARCDEKTTQVADRMETRLREGNVTSSSLAEGQRRDIRRRLCPVYSELHNSETTLARRSNRCEDFTSNAIALAGQAGNAAVVVKMAELCKNAAQAVGPPIDPFGLPSQDYVQDFSCANPANASLPRCQDCNLPENINSAYCKVPGVGETAVNRTSLQKADFGTGGDDSFNVGDEDAPSGDVSPFGNFDPGDNRTSGVGAGSSGFGSGGDSGGGGGFNPSGGENPNKAFDTDVLSGTRGGSGYSSGSGGSGYRRSAGSFKGYGQGKTGEGSADKLGKSFNLKSYLPGGKNDPRKKRGVAGLPVAFQKKIGRSSENIWMKISNRFFELCKLNRLYDCKNISRRERY